MPTKDYGRLFTARVGMPDGLWPPATRTVSKEIAPPWRTGYGLAFRSSTVVIGATAALLALLFKIASDDRAFAVGWWSAPQHDLTTPVEERIRRAAGARINVASREEVRAWRAGSSVS